MTESSPVSHVQPQENAVLGGCGHPVPNTIAKIVDITTGAALGPNEDGELCVAGPQVMKGYHRNDKATKKTIMKGWLHTGDIAKYNEDGQFFIIDRLKELIKVKGLQVISILYSHDYQYRNTSPTIKLNGPQASFPLLIQMNPKFRLLHLSWKISFVDVQEFLMWLALVFLTNDLGNYLVLTSLEKIDMFWNNQS